ncbi:hypothetical protein [Duganella violaceipulchra]|uniref:YCII-related domain-containing protein n=1 Tax=Duganella violaceipulchra TaxID=2849652 RepID=A0AA41HD82_9BURK|nr:hypothetical protein [Duganella violaceicalia]MBV6325260.1 hypothetical protein [Duganella violaceicalia]MCP2012473.1 hypothetical protein [Duganella violaceicalia]
MNDYIILMLDDTAHPDAASSALWASYITSLRQGGLFDGGSSIGKGALYRKGAPADSASLDVTGYLRVRATNLDDAARFLVGNPHYEAGGGVEIRELPTN